MTTHDKLDREEAVIIESLHIVARSNPDPAGYASMRRVAARRLSEIDARRNLLLAKNKSVG